ncbi:MAG: diaminopimelate epimerase [Gemmatimonadetes bacterium]|nr:diaminopimelate epimerase [Gemmatimonadota bacterium]NIO33370.1 diaminopimelate epimerase [Gemmatimonadota bacterium]
MPNDKAETRLRFCKISGAGNDFILLNAAAAAKVPDLGELALELCRRGTSVGADGLMVVGPSEREDADVRVRFWNPDGREFGTCGNGTRCAARFAALEGLAADQMVIDTDDGDIEARVSGSEVALRYRIRPTVELDRSVTGGEGERTGHYVQVGIPHLVLPLGTMPEGPIEPLCRPLRSAPELGPAGANVNLVEVIDRHRIRIRTYERGVEAETLACGSGSISAAVALCAAGRVESPVEVTTRSGDRLTVRFRRGPDGRFSELELEGPARVVYWGTLGQEPSAD